MGGKREKMRITVLIHSGSDGRYKAKEIMRQIQEANVGIEFPAKPLSETCLADLRYQGKPCAYAYSEGTVWNNDLCTYTERKLIMCFG